MSFVKSLSIKKELDEEVKKQHRQILLGVLIGVSMETPRDTGRARYNWIISHKVVDTTQLPKPSSSSQGSSTAIRNGKVVAEKTQPYTVSYIQNNLPYINRLNEGWSQQRGARYVEAIISKVVNRVGGTFTDN
jgi:hypothetical protein